MCYPSISKAHEREMWDSLELNKRDNDEVWGESWGKLESCLMGKWNGKWNIILRVGN